MDKTFYRMEFPLSSKPAYRRRHELLDKVETLKKELKKRGHYGVRGITNVSCYAPYSNYAICTCAAGGETEWLPQTVNEIGEHEEKIRKFFISPIVIEPVKPTVSALKSEEEWVEKSSQTERERATKGRVEAETAEKAWREKIERIKAQSGKGAKIQTTINGGKAK